MRAQLIAGVLVGLLALWPQLAAAQHGSPLDAERPGGPPSREQCQAAADLLNNATTSIRSQAAALGITHAVTNAQMADIAYNAVVDFLAYPSRWSPSAVAHVVESELRVVDSDEPIARVDINTGAPPEARQALSQCESLGISLPAH